MEFCCKCKNITAGGGGGNVRDIHQFLANLSSLALETPKNPTKFWDLSHAKLPEDLVFCTESDLLIFPNEFFQCLKAALYIRALKSSFRWPMAKRTDRMDMGSSVVKYMFCPSDGLPFPNPFEGISSSGAGKTCARYLAEPLVLRWYRMI